MALCLAARQGTEKGPDILDEPFESIAIIGVGLLGGSIGMAALQRKLARKVVGIHRDGDPEGQAIALGATSTQTYSIEEGVADVDMVFVCTPARAVVEKVQLVAENCRPGTIITDVASTKANIVAEIGGGVPFVGGHPLAGSHQSGVEFANAELFAEKTTVLTPSEETDPKVLETVSGVWAALGAQVRCMGAEEHDLALAMTSHLPHWIASALSLATPQDLLPLVASGWKDTTRVSAGNVEMWTDIFMENRDQLLVACDKYQAIMHQFRQALEAADDPAIESLLEQGKQNRDAVAS